MIGVSIQWLTAAAVVAAIASGLVSLGADRHPRLLRQGAFPLLAVSGTLSVAVAALALLDGAAFAAELPFGLPWLHWHLRLDPLAGFFLGIIGIVTAVVSIYGPSYTHAYQQSPYSLGVLGLFTGLFIAGMQLVVLADDAFAFMVAWEVMSVASYFLVAYEHHHAANRRAAFLYLLMAQIGAVLILLCFGIFAGLSDGFTFGAFRAADIGPFWAGLAFALGLAGFGMKAGLFPLHVWLPEAHPVAPSHVSALMSGVMLKVAIYGFMRLLFDLLGALRWEWGLVLLTIGSLTAVYGVLYALIQTDLKRVLAYSSVENIGIVFICLGLSVTYLTHGAPGLGVLGLVAALYHCVNHALFKSLLFLNAGAVIERSHEHDLEAMGGLLRRMPWTGLFFLVGCMSISALPPFNGFVSEWLTFQTALQATSLDSGVLRAIVPIVAAILALTGALAAACFVRAYGISFLGQPRSRHVRRAREVKSGMLVAQGTLAVLCLVFGVLPTTFVGIIGTVTESLLDRPIVAATRHGWLWLTPISPETASYSAPLVMLGVLAALAAWIGVWAWLRRRREAKPIVRRDPWDCGFGGVTARMQYTATAFAMPFQQVFRPVWRLNEQRAREMDGDLPTRPGRLEYHLEVEDRAWRWFYAPVGHLVLNAARRVARIQTGHIRHYLAYSFVTLIVLLWLIT
jgi:formate hydrogenlyase subunit 3/multisubunit Na+/H+ antiporter MnhD subunit